MTERLFPIMPASHGRLRDAGVCTVVIALPWALIAPHEAQASRNHGGQSLERLAERGGLGACEAVAVLEDRPWRGMASAAANSTLAGMVARWRAGQAEKLDGIRHAEAIEAALHDEGRQS